MLIRYTGIAHNRVVGDYTWTRQRRVLPVSDKDIVKNLITLDGFSIDEQDPLAQLAGVDVAQTLVIEHDVCCVAELSQIKKSELKKLAESLGVKQSQLSDWVTSAKEAPPEAVAESILGDADTAVGG